MHQDTTNRRVRLKTPTRSPADPCIGRPLSEVMTHRNCGKFYGVVHKGSETEYIGILAQVGYGVFQLIGISTVGEANRVCNRFVLTPPSKFYTEVGPQPEDCHTKAHALTIVAVYEAELTLKGV